MSDDPAFVTEALKEAAAVSAPRVDRESLPIFRQIPSSSVIPSADLELLVSVELGRVRMRLADVLQLAEGSVLELDKRRDDPVDIVINDQLVARGEVVVLNQKFAIRITEVMPRTNPTRE